MNKVFKLSGIITASLMLPACTMLTPQEEITQRVVADVEQAREKSTYEKKTLVKNVNHYAKWLVQDLFSHIDAPNNNSAFAIANFALLDSDLKTTNHFGRQINEAIMHETSRLGFAVFDLKSTGRLQFTEAGDIFWHSENIDELSGNFDINYVITGTMTKHQGGYLINARVIDVNSSILLSSAQIFTPAEVVEAVLSEKPENKKGFPIMSLTSNEME